jgi:hypothetical protein
MKVSQQLMDDARRVGKVMTGTVNTMMKEAQSTINSMDELSLQLQWSTALNNQH